jgi:hypothetical protein
VKPFNSIVILSHVWTGSSIFAGLLQRAGYWVGTETVKKPEFDTYENARLVELNSQLLHTLHPACGGRPLQRTRGRADRARREPPGPAATPRLRHPVRAGTLLAWKDPQLTWTVRAWARVADFSRTAFLTLSRSDLQSWITLNQRSHVQSWNFTRRHNQAINRSNQAFALTHGAQHLHLTLEDLLLKPEGTLDRLNDTFGLYLGMGDLQSVCHLPLYRKRRDWRDFTGALKNYLKHYHARDGRGSVLNSEAA